MSATEQNQISVQQIYDTRGTKSGRQYKFTCAICGHEEGFTVNSDSSIAHLDAMETIDEYAYGHYARTHDM